MNYVISRNIKEDGYAIANVVNIAWNEMYK